MNSNIPSPSLQVLPWNGHKSALSLTFDDGVPVHLDLVIPELNKRGLKGTFYVVAGRLTDIQRWKAAISDGHEIGNHSMDHKRVQDLKPGEEFLQVAGSKEKLENLLQAPVTTYAYPFTEISPELKRAVETHHFLARGGNRGVPYLEANLEPDWMDLPSQVALSELGMGTYEDWMAENLNRLAWTLFQLHGIEGAPLGWQPMPRNVFFRLLDELNEKKADIWIAPLAEIGTYWRCQRALEKAIAQPREKGWVFSWKKPALCPTGMTLKMKLPTQGYRFSQAGKYLQPLHSSTYSVSFDALELVLEPIEPSPI